MDNMHVINGDKILKSFSFFLTREEKIDKDTYINLKSKYKLYCFDLGIDTGYFKG